MMQNCKQHPFIQYLSERYHKAVCDEGSDELFVDIMETATVRFVCTREKCSYGQIKAYLFDHLNTVVVVFHAEDENFVDLYALSVLDDRPVVVHDLNWRETQEFWALESCHSGLEYIFELDRKFGRRRVERCFVNDFKEACRRLSSLWYGMTIDTPEVRSQLALHTLIRLLFIAFLESRHALDGRLHFMMEEALRCEQSGLSIYHDFIQPLFFHTLNCQKSRRRVAAKRFGQIPFLNGGLFTPTKNELSNPGLMAPNEFWHEIIFGMFSEYIFRTGVSGEDLRHSLDPMMIGHVFESLMSSEKRSVTGSFYTPMHLARTIVSQVMTSWIVSECGLSEEIVRQMCESNDFSGLTLEDAQRVNQKLSEIRILENIPLQTILSNVA